MDSNYCNEICPIGVKARDKFLASNNSVYDAVIDFRFFVAECIKTCPYKKELEQEIKQ